MIVKIKPQRKVVFCQKLSGDERSLPLLAWQYLTIQTSIGHVVDPVLACARSKNISFFQVMIFLDLVFIIISLFSIRSNNTFKNKRYIYSFLHDVIAFSDSSLSLIP